jgi:hypothetical protein
MRGITDKTDKKEEIVKIDEYRAIRYRLVEEEVNLDALREELTANENTIVELTSELIEIEDTYGEQVKNILQNSNIEKQSLIESLEARNTTIRGLLQ